MKGKLFVMDAPKDIFGRLDPELQKRMVYVPNFLKFPESKIRQVSRYLLAGRIPLPKKVLSFWFPAKEMELLQTAGPDDNILFYECTNARIMKVVRHILPDQTCHIYYCNPIRSTFRHPEKELEAIAGLGYRLSSFDPYDARQYGLKYTGQYFCYPGKIPDAPYASDCFFCGLPKNRVPALDSLRKLLETQGFKCDFVIPKTPAEKLSYPEYLKRLSQTQCVIDICQKGQTGLTRRPLEALFYDKKLVTNNDKIVEYDFYKPENIFLLGKDPIDKLRSFMSSPVEKVPCEIKDRYDINRWVSQFLNEQPV